MVQCGVFWKRRKLSVLQCWEGRISLLMLVTKVTLAFLALVFIQLLSAVGQFSVLLGMTTFLTRAVHQTDTIGSIVYGVYGAAAVLWSIIGGPIVDRFSFKIVLIVGCLMASVGRFLAATLVTSNMVYAAIAVFMSLGDAWTNLALISAVKIHVPNDNLRKILFGVIYGVLNVGAVVSGALFDLRFEFPNLNSITVVNDGPLQSLFIIAGICTSAAFFISIFTPPAYSTHVDVDKSQQHEEEKGNGDISPRVDYSNGGKTRIIALDEDVDTASRSNPLLLENDPVPTSGWFSALSSASFWRIALFSIVCLGVRSVYLHLDTTFPTVLRRLYGPDAPIGAMYMINPLLITFLAPIVQVATVSMSVMKLIIVGTILTALSPFILLLARPSDLGIAAIVLFAIVLSLGEALWSPLSRFYITQIAGSERVGTYLSMLSVIVFLPKLPTSYLSAFVLEQYCPSDVTIPCQLEKVGLIIAIVALFTPCFLIVFVVLRIILPLPAPVSDSRGPSDNEDADDHELSTQRRKEFTRLDNLEDDPVGGGSPKLPMNSVVLTSTDLSDED